MRFSLVVSITLLLTSWLDVCAKNTAIKRLSGRNERGPEKRRLVANNKQNGRLRAASKVDSVPQVDPIPAPVNPVPDVDVIPEPGEGDTREIDSESVPTVKTAKCLLIEALYLFAKGHEPKPGKEVGEKWRCEFKEEDNAIRSLKNLPDGFIEEHKIESGHHILTITWVSDGTNPVNDKSDVFTIPKEAKLEVSESDEDGAFRHRRMKVAKSGNHTVLVFRVTDIEGLAPVHSAAEIADNIFGTTNDIHNLQSQYSACSGGKLNFFPAEGHPAIVNGVAELNVPFPVKYKASSMVENWVTQLAPGVVGDLDQWTLVMYILPRVVNFSGAAAYTYVDSRHSVFLEQYSSNLLVLMHEIGHNLGNRHSGEGSLSYDDGTCMMGAHVYEDDAPEMCFNGAKSWFFEWYDERHVIVDPMAGPWEGEMVGIDDYLNGQSTDADQAVVVKVESSTSADLYLLYNRKEGVNSMVTEMGDLVTVVEQGTPDGQSWLLAGLSELTMPYRYPGFNSGEWDLVIEVCDRIFGTPDYAKVIMYLDDGTDHPSCSVIGGGIVDRDVDSEINGETESGIDGGKDPDGPETDGPGTGGTIETAEFIVAKGKDAFRERGNGSMKKNLAVHALFQKDWTKQGFRFTASGSKKLPPNAIIESAALLITPVNDEDALEGELRGKAVGKATGNARGWFGEKKITGEPLTTSEVAIDPKLPKWRPDRYEELVDVAPIVQEIVRRGDYSEGNAIEIYLLGEDRSGSRKFKTGLEGTPIRLRVTYRMPSPPKSTAFGFEGKGLTDGRGWGNEESFEGEVVEVELHVLDKTDDFKESHTGGMKTNLKTDVLWNENFAQIAFRFQKVPVPQGAKILEANLELNARAGTTRNKINGEIRGENTGDSPPFKWKKKLLSEANKTTASVKVYNLPTWKANKYNSIGDVAPIVQEIINRSDYQEGNAIKLILANRGSKAMRKVKNANSGKPPRLTIRYTLR